ncbi:MAG: hypothetical protein GY938_16940 [Ketobacter sp.]|nr:hypothetical protein [Ketobacter sp.]
MGRTRAYPRSQSSIDRERKANHLDRYKMRECRFFEYTNEGRRQTPKAIFLNGIWLPLSQSWHWDIYDTREWNKSIYMCSIVAIPKWLAKKKDMSLFKEIELTHLYGGYENQGYQVSIF